MFGVNYTDAQTADNPDKTQDVNFQRYVVGVGHDYPCNKRTDMYAVASYMQDAWEDRTKTQEGEF